MIYQVAKILEDVRVFMGLNAHDTELLITADQDTLSLDALIRSKICDGVDYVHLHAPSFMLEGGHVFGDELYWGELFSGWLLLPRDFLRLVVFEMSDWEQPVYVALSSDDPRYMVQRSRFKGLRGTPQKPVCVLSMHPEGRVLEFYSCKSDGAVVSSAVYLPRAVIDKNDGVDVSERCYRAVVAYVSGLVCVSLGETDRGSQLFDYASTLLQ